MIRFFAFVLTLLIPSLSFGQFGNALERMKDQMREQQQRIREMQDRAQQQMQDATGRLPFGQSSSAPQPWADEEAQITEGLRVTPGKIVYSQGERFVVRDETGEPTVARHHVTIGSTRIVLMPDGRLESVSESDVSPTEQPFVPMDVDALEAKLLSDPKLAGFEAIRSRRFLYLHNSSDRFIRSSRTILESMYPAVRKYFSRSSIDVHEPELTMVVIAFATEKEFQDFRKMPRGVVAYYDSLSNAVYLYEQSELSKHAPEIAVKNAISTIAHEGAHQILHNIGVQQRLSRWPLWLSEGLAEFYAPTSVSRGIRWSGLGATNELRMFEIDKDWQTSGGKTSPTTIKRIVSADQLGSLEYAYSWSLIHMMSKRHQDELFACMRAASELRPFEGTPLGEESNLKPESIYRENVTDSDSEIAIELTKHLRNLNYVNPIHNQTHYLVVAGLRVYLTSSPEKVKEIRSTSGGRFQVKEFPNRALAERAMKSLTH